MRWHYFPLTLSTCFHWLLKSYCGCFSLFLAQVLSISMAITLLQDLLFLACQNISWNPDSFYSNSAFKPLSINSPQSHAYLHWRLLTQATFPLNLPLLSFSLTILVYTLFLNRGLCISISLSLLMPFPHGQKRVNSAGLGYSNHAPSKEMPVFSSSPWPAPGR